MKTKTKTTAKLHSSLKKTATKTRKQVSKSAQSFAAHSRKHGVLKTISKKKLIKQKHSLHVARSFFIVIVALCTGSLAVALASARPSANIHVQTSLRPGTTIQGAPPVQQLASGVDQVGRGSWYALGLPAPDSLTCASRKFGRGTYLEVKNLRNGKTVVCRVNDYGPEVWTGRVIDLSRGSFREVEDLGAGTIPVQIRVVPAPLGINLRIPNVVGEILGYARCNTEHDSHFCELNRQAADLLK